MVEPNMPMPIKAIPYAHQIEAFNFVCDKLGLDRDFPVSTGTALLMEMGTGKTITTIAVIGALAERKKIHKVLIVSQPTLPNKRWIPLQPN